MNCLSNIHFSKTCLQKYPVPAFAKARADDKSCEIKNAAKFYNTNEIYTHILSFTVL
jgi:hypothetical protein